MAMMDWLAVLCRLPAKFKVGYGGGGVIQGTSSEAVLVALLAARAKSLRSRPAADKLKLVAYSSDQVRECDESCGRGESCSLVQAILVR